MMFRLLLAFPFLLAFAEVCAQAPAPAQPAAASESPAAKTPNPAGKVELAEGDVAVYDKAKQPRKVKPGDAVLEGEGIVTGKDGELHLNMEDGGYIAVRPNTKMRIVAYQARGDSDDKGIFGLLQGAFRSVTGWIGKYNPKSYQVRTPTATIGVRGTDHEPLVIPQGAAEGEPGTYDKVNIGGSYIQTKHGRVEVASSQAAFAPLRGKAVPHVLAQVPHFYRPTRNEHLLASKHEQIHKVLDQRRDERRKVIEERRKTLGQQKDARRKTPAERGKGHEMPPRQLRGERPEHPREERLKRLQEQRPNTGRHPAQAAAGQHNRPERQAALHGQHPRPAEGGPERRRSERENGPRRGGAPGQREAERRD